MLFFCLRVFVVRYNYKKCNNFFSLVCGNWNVEFIVNSSEGIGKDFIDLVESNCGCWRSF